MKDDGNGLAGVMFALILVTPFWIAVFLLLKMGGIL